MRQVWDGFRGKSLIEQQRIIHQALAGALEDGRIHALKIKTFTPEQVSK
jgi:acid stress-induced BolA-like protein IbaG/YrbA